MDNVKLHKLPAMVLGLLVTTVLALGLSTVGCGGTSTDDDHIVRKLVLTIPIDDGSKDIEKVAPESVESYQICAFDKDGDATYAKRFYRNKENTKDYVTSLTLRKDFTNAGEITGITYGTKTIMVNYFEGSTFLGYTLFTGLDLENTKELIVDRVFLANLVKETDAITLTLNSNIKNGPAVAAKDEEEEIPEAQVDQMITLETILNVKTNPGVTDDAIALDATNSELITFEVTANSAEDPESGDVVTAWEKHPGCYRCTNAGYAAITATYGNFEAASQTFEVNVIDVQIMGYLDVTVSSTAAAELSSDIAYVEVEGYEGKINVADNKFTVMNAHTSTTAKEVVFYNSDEEEIGTGILPAFKITTKGSTATAEITTVVPANAEEE